MCWESKNRPVKHIAKEDIPVFKIMESSQDKLTSFYYRFEYQKGEVYYNPLGDVQGNTEKEYIINSGFHSYSPNCRILFSPFAWAQGILIYSLHKDKTLDIIWPLKENYVKVSCIIPKDSIYYVNEYGEYVSNQIKVIEKMEHVLD